MAAPSTHLGRYRNEIKQDRGNMASSCRIRAEHRMTHVGPENLPPALFPPPRERQLRPDPFSYHILSMPDPTPAIAVRDLRKVYDGKAAVDGLSLTVPRGSFLGYLGPNGAAKSTTIRMLTGRIPAPSGSIELLGLPMSGEAQPTVRRRGFPKWWGERDPFCAPTSNEMA